MRNVTVSFFRPNAPGTDFLHKLESGFVEPRQFKYINGTWNDIGIIIVTDHHRTENDGSRHSTPKNGLCNASIQTMKPFIRRADNQYRRTRLNFTLENVTDSVNMVPLAEITTPVP